MSFKQHKFNDYEGIKKAAEGCTIRIWRLAVKKFGLMMRVNNDPEHGSGAPGLNVKPLSLGHARLVYGYL